jgi:HSP20 family protein
MEVTAPAVDLYEEKDDIVVKAELPGIDKNNIEVNLTDHTLTIKGEKKKEEEVKEENYYRSERSYGSFIRTWSCRRTFIRTRSRPVLKTEFWRLGYPRRRRPRPKK